MIDWLKLRPEGLYCAGGDFFIDPLQPVQRAVITHGHADHARGGNTQVLATPETLRIMDVRYKEFAGETRQPLNYREPIVINGVTLTFYPAGHILGSAQAVMEFGGQRAVVSGDYKRRPDLTCELFEPVPCDLFITEATFGLPIFTHPDDKGEAQKLLDSIALFPDRTHLVGCYALGKCQRLIMLLREIGYDAPIYLHGAHIGLCDLYQSVGIPLGDLRPVAGEEKKAFPGAIVLCPPSALNDRWARRFGEPVLALASGWMRVRARARQKGIDLPLIISDHADWPELVQTLHDVHPETLWVTHGEEEALVYYARNLGMKAEALSLALKEDGDDG